MNTARKKKSTIENYIPGDLITMRIKSKKEVNVLASFHFLT